MSVEDNILYICNSSVCSCVRLNLKNLFYFVCSLSLWLCGSQRGEAFSFLGCFNTHDFYHFYHFYQTCPKFSRTTRGKIFKNRHTHTHTDIVVEKEKEKPRTRDDDNERRKR